MSAAPTITNRFRDFQLLDVSKTTRHPEHRGPYMMIQHGSAPEDPQLRECTFTLTKRGTWLHCYVFFLLPKPVRRQVAVFETVPELMELAENLPSKPIVESVESLSTLLKEGGFSPTTEDAENMALWSTVNQREAKGGMQ